MEYFQKNILLKKIVYIFARHRAEKIFGLIEEFLDKKEIILDIGCGSGNIVEILNQNNYNVISIDIKNLSIIDEIKPILYNGTNMPFKDNTFDLSIILTVLHHTNQQDEVLKEAIRVTKNRILIIEDIYKSFMINFAFLFFSFEQTGFPCSSFQFSYFKRFFTQILGNFPKFVDSYRYAVLASVWSWYKLKQKRTNIVFTLTLGIVVTRTCPKLKTRFITA